MDEEDAEKVQEECLKLVRGLKGKTEAHGAEIRHQNDTVHGIGVKTDQVEDRVVVGNVKLKRYR
jgi:hypothetical protein